MCQPPNSADLNVLDLGFFNGIQALQQKEAHTTIDGLIEAMDREFGSFSLNDSNKIFLSLHASIVEIIKIKGSNDQGIRKNCKCKVCY